MCHFSWSPCFSCLFSFWIRALIALVLFYLVALVAPVYFELEPLLLCFYFIRGLVAPVYFELGPLLLWFYFIWGPWCYCLFWIRALFALVTGYCGDTVSAMPVTKKYYLLYFESSVLVLGTCCCFLVFCRCLLVVHSDPSSHLLRPWRLWSPPLRSMWGDGVWLSMAAYYPQPSNPPFCMNPWQHNLCHEQQPCSLCNPSNLLQHQQQTSPPCGISTHQRWSSLIYWRLLKTKQSAI